MIREGADVADTSLAESCAATAGPEGGGSVPRELALSPNWPNPFNSQTRFRLRLPEAGFVTLRVCDALGRRVRTLVSEHLEAGVWVQTWDGEDETGAPMGSGVYVFRVETRDEALSRKLMLVR